ncbi:unnamed protein product [Tuber aestivum]|uniref:Uncharacterized protein n=1 Tax=Tuber aestivum TaxID=59557 RepID=A0A292PU00_9PEZI|nr:unnamed protein product [Tuber aestivum]
MQRRKARLILRVQPWLILKNELDHLSPAQVLLVGDQECGGIHVDGRLDALFRDQLSQRFDILDPRTSTFRQ